MIVDAAPEVVLEAVSVSKIEHSAVVLRVCCPAREDPGLHEGETEVEQGCLQTCLSKQTGVLEIALVTWRRDLRDRGESEGCRGGGGLEIEIEIAHSTLVPLLLLLLLLLLLFALPTDDVQVNQLRGKIVGC